MTNAIAKKIIAATLITFTAINTASAYQPFCGIQIGHNPAPQAYPEVDPNWTPEPQVYPEIDPDWTPEPQIYPEIDPNWTPEPQAYPEIDPNWTPEPQVYPAYHSEQHSGPYHIKRSTNYVTYGARY